MKNRFLFLPMLLCSLIISTCSLDTKDVVLSGTITIEYEGKPVPYVEIRASSLPNPHYVSTDSYSTVLKSPQANASWTIISPSYPNENIIFRIIGYKNANTERENILFDFHVFDIVKLERVNESKKNIVLDQGRGFNFVTLSGTITGNFTENNVANIVIRTTTDPGFKIPTEFFSHYRSIGTSYIKVNEDTEKWSMAVPVLSEEIYLNYYLEGYSSAGESKFYIFTSNKQTSVLYKSKDINNINFDLNK